MSFTVTGAIDIGGGDAPADVGVVGNVVRVRSVHGANVAGRTLLPEPVDYPIAEDGTFSVDVVALPEGHAYEWVFVLGGGRWASRARLTAPPTASTAYADLVDVTAPSLPGYAPPPWAAGVLEARDEVTSAAGVVATAAGEVATARDEVMLAKQGVEAVVATNDGIMSTVAADPASAFSQQLSTSIAGQISAEAAPLVAAAITAADIPGQATTAVDAKLEEAGVVVDSDFSGDAGLYNFPNPGDAGATRYRIRPTDYAPSANLIGQSTGLIDPALSRAIIAGRPNSGTLGVFSVTSDGQAMQAVAGTSALTCLLVPVGQAVGVNRVTIKGLNAVGSAQSLGAYIAGLFQNTDIRMLRWGISGTSRVYVLQKATGTGLGSLTSTTLVATTRVAQVDDVVELILTDTHVLSLRVNGTQIASYTLTESEWTTFGANTYAGLYGTPSSGSAPKFGSWEWAPQLPTGIPKMVAVGSSMKLPEGVKLSDTQRGEVASLTGYRRFNILDYGAKMDTVLVTDAVTTAGQPTVSSASRAFTAADVGKTIYVIGAGPVVANANDGVWISTIQSVTSGVATLASNATASVSAARCAFGTPDDAAFTAAQAAASAASGIAFGLTGGEVWIPEGRTMVTQPLAVVSFVDWAGASRERSWVHVVMDRPGNAASAGVTDWLTCAGRSSANPLVGARFHDFGVEAEAMIHTEGYGSALKPLNIYYVQRCSIERMNVWNTPATAIPFDHSYDQCVIRANVILNPGRLAPSGVGPGGSGIGAGTKANGATEPTVIEGNVIIGKWSATVAANGHNGIFTEAQTGADPDAGVPGYRIVNNTIIGMYYGISDCGSTGTIITGNVIVGCSRGVSLRKTTLPDAYPGLNTIIADNTIIAGTGPGATDGVGIAITTPTGTADKVRSYVHTLIHDNQIIGNKSWGISLSAGDFDISGVDIHDNQILRNGRSGIRLVSGATSKIKRPSIHHNLIANNGKQAVSGDQAAILVTAGTTVERGRIQDNDWWDDQGTATQIDGLVSTGATLTSVRVDGNGDI